MPKVVAAQLQAGMEVAEDIRDASGTVILRRGNTLSETTIRRLQNRGIDTIEVAGEESPARAVRTPESKSLSEAELTRQENLADVVHRFERVLHDPFMEQLKLQTVKHFFPEEVS
jgi:hypothetical protein